MLRVLIADDELLARRRLARLCGEIHGVEVVGEAVDGAGVLARVREPGVDVVLLDVEMPGLTGVDAMRLWPEGGPAIVFVTAHAEHAVSAFDGGAIDYVLKPVDPARLARALARVRVPAGPLALQTRQGVVLVPAEAVVAVLVEGASIVVVSDRGRHFTERPLAELHARLGPRFVRAHRGALLNLDRVARFEPVDSGGYRAWTDLDVTVPVSRQVARDLRRRWGI